LTSLLGVEAKSFTTAKASVDANRGAFNWTKVQRAAAWDSGEREGAASAAFKSEAVIDELRYGKHQGRHALSGFPGIHLAGDVLVLLFWLCRSSVVVPS
jgi:hypothetical protein